MEYLLHLFLTFDLIKLATTNFDQIKNSLLFLLRFGLLVLIPSIIRGLVLLKSLEFSIEAIKSNLKSLFD